MANPLSLLREYNVNKNKIIERDSQIIFGKFSWPKNVKTNYLMWTGTDGMTKEYYTLECLLFILKNISLTHSVYVKQASAENIPVVRRPDRKDLLAYLNGESTNCGGIDKTGPLELPTQVKRFAEYDGPENIAKKPRFEDFHVQKVQEQLAVDNIKSLSEAMSVENIAAIKAKRLAKKRATITGNKDISQEYAILDPDVDVTKEIISRERQWQTRTTILQSNGKSFAKNIFAMLDSIKARKQSKQRPMQQVPVAIPRQTPFKLKAQTAVYNRYEQERFIKKKEETEGFEIDTKGTYHGMTLRSVTEGSVKTGPPTASLPTESQHNDERQQRPQSGTKRVSRTPIIIIPAGASSLVSMYNVKEVLQDLKFVSIEVKRAKGARRDNEVLLQRQRNGVTVPYRVVDNPAKLSPSDWDRVVAVFVMGPAWQFKGYPWKNPTEIFSKICAFHLKYDDMKPDNNVARWSVTTIKLSRMKRHLDRAALMVFWEKVDKHILQQKPHLRF